MDAGTSNLQVVFTDRKRNKITFAEYMVKLHHYSCK
ncbi:MAG: hypothetical protein H6Q64_1601 [Firmicutes bacterium]|nr:hypothetical protein [Bacillota bacterium]